LRVRRDQFRQNCKKTHPTVQAHYMILKDSLNFELEPSEKKIVLVALSEIQNGREIQDSHQTIKFSRFVKNNANNLQLRILED
jgi:hypothetical protein